MSAEIISLKARRKAVRQAGGLCQHGFHKWSLWKEKQFDSRQGKLVTVYQCKHCRAQKVKAH